ncbi:hypothetical protein B9N43_13290 [Denitratisoma sp. DHT3]|uniref:sensor domain-containing diguanylate cyclase n=1 Tax=Denitratisoma sp. DHT3 TaxID=1981880 RepID=UPI0011986C54|nr:diguanylate cyclase [Denitratisoma sp. DHT3]QDX82132.1 hypothetical protein B9N43_13290 [Denitratisoma sp. DHT3]
MRQRFFVPLVGFSSFLLVILFVALALGRNAREREDFEKMLAEQAARAQTAFQVAMANQQDQLVTLAALVANSPRVSALFARGREAVLAEGGGAGHRRAAEIRAALLQEVEPSWRVLQQQFGLRQLHFFLAPGALSFLRIHVPEKFGDRIDEIRPLVVDVNRDRRARSGFEIGRVHSGVRGVAPVSLPTAEGGATAIGAVEAGGSFEPILSLLDRQLTAGFAVVVDRARLESVVWPANRPPAGEKYVSCDCYLDTATRPEVRAWLAAGVLPAYGDRFTSSLLAWRGRTYQVVRFPLRDYLGGRDPRRAPVGSVLVWSDVSDAVTGLRHQTWRNVVINAFGFLAAEILLLLLLRYSRAEWQRQLDNATAAAQADRQAIASLSRRNELLLMSVGEGIFGIDRQRKVSFVNPAALKMLGYAREEAIGQDAHTLFHHRQSDGRESHANECPMHQTLQDGVTRTAEDWLFRKDGSGFPVQWTITAMIDQGVIEGAVAAFQDIEVRRRTEEEMLRLATTDTLTGVPNRRSFMEQGKQEMERVKRFTQSAAFLMLDLDFFKRVNDNYGHIAGDAALRHFAIVARESLRRVDIFGRVGGEEFAAVLPGTDEAGALELAERLRTTLEQSPAQFQGIAIPMTVSIGLTLLKPADVSLDNAISRADAALYRAKQQGRNRVEVIL